MEQVTIEYGIYETAKKAYAGIYRVNGRKWRPDGYVATGNARQALAGAFTAATEEGQRYRGDYTVVIVEHPGGLVSSPWGR